MLFRRRFFGRVVAVGGAALLLLSPHLLPRDSVSASMAGVAATPSPSSSASPAPDPAETIPADSPPRTEQDAHAGLAAWVDLYDDPVWDSPAAAVRKMDAKGVTTLYLETANFRLRRDFYRPRSASVFIETAHALGMNVVAWYLPGYDDLRRDRRRTLAALDFRTRSGEAFDGFALDIEATEVRDIARRNARASRLSRWLRSVAGEEYRLAAIVPEAGALYWPGFPYEMVCHYYDVVLPMAYFTYRTSGRAGVHDFISRNVATIRRECGASSDVHVIGGIAADSTRSEVAALVDAARDRRAIGVSLYDFATTRRVQWRELARF